MPGDFHSNRNYITGEADVNVSFSVLILLLTIVIINCLVSANATNHL
jgi:hypothetical protein